MKGPRASSASLNPVIQRLPRRAEVSSPAELDRTFVEIAPLFNLLRSRDHQILYGRRGTGKTHALKYLKSRLEQRGEASLYVNLSKLGDAGGLYEHASMSIQQRGTPLLVDVLTPIYNYLVDRALVSGADR